MVTIAKLGFGVLKFTAKGVKLFVDTAISGGKIPEFRMDEGESSGSNSDLHVHFGDSPGQSVASDVANILLGAASTEYSSSRRERDNLLEQDYLLLDSITKEYLLKKYKDAY